MLFAEGVPLLLLKRTVNSVLAKYFLILVMAQQINSQSSIEGYEEAYRVRTEKGGKGVNYNDAYKEDGSDYAESVADDMHKTLLFHKIDSHEHERKGNGKSKDSKKEKPKKANKKDHNQNDLSYHHHGDYEYMDEPENEEGYLDPEVEHIIIQC